MVNPLRRLSGPKPGHCYRDKSYQWKTITVRRTHPGYVVARLYRRGQYGGDLIVTDYELTTRYEREQSQ
jgi:hypothetical protein